MILMIIEDKSIGNKEIYLGEWINNGIQYIL